MPIDADEIARDAAPPADASADWWRGRLFPNACDDRRSRFEPPPDPLLVRIRHLPTAGILEEAATALGPRARPLLAAWRALWVAAVGDVDAFAEEAGVDGEEGFDDWREGRLREAAALHGGGETADAMAITLDALTRRDGRVRPRHLHAAEDAATHVALSRSALAVAMRVGRGPDRLDGFVGKQAGERGLRPLGGLGDLDLCRRADAASTRQQEADNPYWTSPAFRARAGRGLAFADDHPTLLLTLADMAGQGHARAFLKGARTKSGTWVVPLDPDPSAMDRILAATLGPDYARLHGFGARPRGMLVQGCRPFAREHRFFVVDHRVAASTPSTRALSVVEADGRMIGRGVAELASPAGSSGAYDRGATATVDDRGLLARMAAGARDLARAMRAEAAAGDAAGDGPRRRGDCYVIDMGSTVDGEVLPIEVNGFLNAGLYAVDYPRIVRALERRAARRAARGGERPGAGDAGGPADALSGDGDEGLRSKVRQLIGDPVPPQPRIPSWPAPEARALDPGLRRAAPCVTVFAELRDDLPAAMDAWGRGLFPDRWTLAPPPGGGPMLRAFVAGHDLPVDPDDPALAPGTPTVLVDALGPDGAVVPVAPFAGLSVRAGRLPGAGASRRDPFRLPGDPTVPAMPDPASIADRVLARMPDYVRGRLAQRLALDRWRRIGPLLGEGGGFPPLSGVEEAIDRLDPDAVPFLRDEWRGRLRAEALSQAAREVDDLARLLGRCAGNGSLGVAIEFPVRPGGLARLLARRPLGRRWRLLYRTERAHENESRWAARAGAEAAVACVEGRVALSDVDPARTVAEGAAWFGDLDAVYLRPGASVLLTAAFHADTADPFPGFGHVARRYVPVDGP